MGFHAKAGRALRPRIVVTLVVTAVAGVGAAPALGVTPAPHLTVHTQALPTHLSSADTAACVKFQFEGPPCDEYQVTATNVGGAAATGPIVLSDTLPAGVKAFGALRLFWAKNPSTFDEAQEIGEGPEGQPLSSEELCKTVGQTVSCELPESIALKPDHRLQIDIYVTVEEGAESAPNEASVSEAGTTVATVEEDDTVSSLVAPFGPSAFTAEITGPDGDAYTQAAGHPYELDTRFDVNTKMGLPPESNRFEPVVVAPPRDVVIDLPVGFVGSTVAAPKCTLAKLQTFPPSCPLSSMVGHLTTEPGWLGAVDLPVFNLVPKAGVPAEFGFRDLLFHTHVIVAHVVPTPAGYIVRTVTREIADVPGNSVIAPFYGNPAEKSGSGVAPTAQFTNPADCSGQPLKTKLYMDSWNDPARFTSGGLPGDLGEAAWAKSEYESPAVTGCEALRFVPQAFSVQPDTGTADSPTGLTADLRIAQSENPSTLATPPLRDATVTLPAGLISNPSAAVGLGSCSEAQIGWLGGSLSNFDAEPPACPDSSKVGSVEVTTPLLERPVFGSLYLAKQNENPFGSLLAMYMVIDDKATGTIVKVPGKVTLDPHTGQLTSTFRETPQMPFGELKLRLFGGAHGVFATPETCGTYTTNGQLTPWSAPASGSPAGVESSFNIGSGCLPSFAPSFSAGTTNPQAGSYASLVLSFSRQDSEQEVSGLTVTLPPGLTARIAGVAKCSDAALEAAANNPSGASENANPSCPAASEVGTVQAQAGVGPDPLSLPGKAYLTGPYKGAPLGLAVVVPALAGPLDLGNVVVRSAVYVDPSDGHVTAVSDPLPTIIHATGADGTTDGFPNRVKAVTIVLNRSAYVLNPTNCREMAVGATLVSTGGSTSSASSRFQATGCRELPFKPTFSVSTEGHASKASGASLRVRVTSALGQANIGKTRVDLPKQLPSRLTTLQKACLDNVFNANPAACPEGSLVGTAVATTPLLATPFTGPAYLVSHGDVKFPDLEIVLQSEGITLVLDGKTDIKKGITISSFETLPDAPVSSFELTLPKGSHSALATNVPEKLNHNLCGQKLNMPTLMTGQNGAIVKQTTKIKITGCPPTKVKKHKKQKRQRHH